MMKRLFFANIHNLGALPGDSEIGEVQLFDTLPENLTYPDIQPHLYHRIQEWEYWRELLLNVKQQKRQC